MLRSNILLNGWGGSHLKIGPRRSGATPSDGKSDADSESAIHFALRCFLHEIGPKNRVIGPRKEPRTGLREVGYNLSTAPWAADSDSAIRFSIRCFVQALEQFEDRVGGPNLKFGLGGREPAHLMEKVMLIPNLLSILLYDASFTR